MTRLPVFDDSTLQKLSEILAVAGGSVPDIVFARATDGWDLGATWRKPKK